MDPPFISFRPHLLARAVVAFASLTIITSLLLVHFIPWRFRIHPYPYLSDAGLRDPERIILSFGLALSSALFAPFAAALFLSQQTYLQSLRQVSTNSPLLSLHLPLSKRKSRLIPTSLPCDSLPHHGLRAGFVLAFFLALLTAVPGWFYLHHIFAIIFALSAAVWCLCHTAISHARCQVEAPHSNRLSRRVKIMYLCIALIAAVVFFFGVIWGSVKLQIPYKMIPNKDPRFILLAFLEYIGITSFLVFIAIVSDELSRERIDFSLQSGCYFKAAKRETTTDV